MKKSSIFCYKNIIYAYILTEGNDYMNEMVSFKKEIEFKTMINNITAISLEHTLMQTGTNSIGGDLIVTGTYKQTEASQIENPFSSNKVSCKCLYTFTMFPFKSYCANAL